MCDNFFALALKSLIVPHVGISIVLNTVRFWIDDTIMT